MLEAGIAPSALCAVVEVSILNYLRFTLLVVCLKSARRAFQSWIAEAMLFKTLCNLGAFRFKNVIFLHGSVGDVIFSTSLLSSGRQYLEECVLVCSVNDRPIMSIFEFRDNQPLVYLSHANILKLRSLIERATLRDYRPLFKFGLIVTHPVLHHNLAVLIDDRILMHRDAFNWSLRLPFNTLPSVPQYDDRALLELHGYLRMPPKELSKMVLINPLCYTHQGLGQSDWASIAKAVQGLGLIPIFNLKTVSRDTREFNVPEGSLMVKIPTHLVPLAAGLTAFNMARCGGAFDLLHIYNLASKSILITIDAGCVSEGKQLDWVGADADRLYISICGRAPYQKIHLDQIEDEQNTYTATRSLLESIRGKIVNRDASFERL